MTAVETPPEKPVSPRLASRGGHPRGVNGVNEDFYATLDSAKSQGRGSCCTVWSFFLLLGAILVGGTIAILGWL